MKFLIHDPINNTYLWTASLSGYGRYKALIEADPYSSNFQIMSISGYDDYFSYFKFKYSYKKCNPTTVNEHTNPATPPVTRISTSFYYIAN